MGSGAAPTTTVSQQTPPPISQQQKPLQTSAPAVVEQQPPTQNSNWAFINMLPPPPALPPPPPPAVVRQQHQIQQQLQQQLQQQIQQQLQQAAATVCEQVGRRPPPVPPRAPPPPPLRTQDSTVSSDSYSQSSSPSYKNMDAPLLPPTPRTTKAPRQLQGLNGGRQGAVGGGNHRDLGTAAAALQALPVAKKGANVAQIAGGALIKSNSTPASLQAVVKMTGSNMSLHHRIIRDIRRPSTARYLSRETVRFRLVQILINAIALLAIGGGLAAYLQNYPSNIRYVNKTVTTTIAILAEDDNPAPDASVITNTMVTQSRGAPYGLCLPVIIPLCQKHGVPYNYTMFPNYMGHLTQRQALQELEIYDAMVDVRCYELAALFLCSLFVPKCSRDGELVRPCASLCQVTWRRCGFFMQVFGLAFPEYLRCELFPESPDPEVCVGQREVMDARQRARRPVCKEGFECDRHRCIPPDWRCDGHVDCEDQTDEMNCKGCPEGMIHCGKKMCIQQHHMCDGIVDCPWAQDERNCLRLNERMGDEATGRLEVFHPQRQSWQPACVPHWDDSSGEAICKLLGYMVHNMSIATMHIPSKPTLPIRQNPLNQQMNPPGGGGGSASSRSAILQEETRSERTVGSQLHQSQLLKEMRACPRSVFPTVEVHCKEYACGRRRLAERPRNSGKGSLRIVGGNEATPGDWPFLAALLGGPEQIFYCAGVLIADQWVLSASHCVGKWMLMVTVRSFMAHSQSDPAGWTVQLGMTRRHAHSYFGQKVKVRRVVPHPLHNKGIAHDNDVALFQLKKPVTFHEHLLPVCLPPADHHLEPQTVCTVIGWGKREDRDVDYEPAVNAVAVPVLTRELCNAWLEENDVNVTESMICAGYPEGGRDACQGDSGGPLLCQDPAREDAWYVGGIVSWGIKCAHPRLPGVYANVPRFVPWIHEQMAMYSD